MNTDIPAQHMPSAPEVGDVLVESEISSGTLTTDHAAGSPAWLPCGPARLRPFSTYMKRFVRSELTYTLAGTWFIDIICLGPLMVWKRELQSGSSEAAFRGLYVVLFLAYGLAMLIELALGVLDRVRPVNIFPTQTCKAVAWTMMFLSLMFIRHDGSSLQVDKTRTAGLFMVSGMLTSYVMLARVRTEQRHERLTYKSHHLCGENCLETEVSRRKRAPLVVNQATSLRYNSPTILRLSNWVQIQMIQARETKGTFRVALAWLVVIMRYLIASVFSSYFILIASRLPGEPKMKYWPTYWVKQVFKDRDDAEREHEAAYFLDEKYKAVILPRQRPLSRRQRMTGEDDIVVSRLRPSPSATSLRTISAPTPEPARPASSLSLMPSATFGNGTSRRRQPLGPRYLCFVTESGTPNSEKYRTCEVEQWRSQHNCDADPSYVFISYTRKQFYTVILNDPSIDLVDANSQLQRVSRDKETLTDYAVKAAKRANVAAFWIDFECVQPAEGEFMEDSVEDVYRICDIVRKAHSISIVVGPPRVPGQAADITGASEKAAWLHQWGDRLWTVPEALLSPSQHDITIYFSGIDEVERIAKRNFAARVYDYDDVDSMQQLIDHYEGSVALGPLQFIGLALECLHRRQTEKRMAGDVAYVLMGLLRQRPNIRKEDSAFQAFARLSLANDSNSILERMICLSPKSASAPWHDLSDAWDAQLWDIKPICDVVQVDDDDERSVILGGMVGSVINWSHLEPVDIITASTDRTTYWCLLRYVAVATVPVNMVAAFAVGVVYLVLVTMLMASQDKPSLQPRTDGEQPQDDSSDSSSDNLLFVIGTLCSIIVSPFVLACLMYLQKGEIVSSQARFFGCEGEPDLDVLEQRLFGYAHGEFIKQTSRAIPGPNQRRFTLIDTYNRVATVFWATEPPEVLMVCGRAGGMLRALLCSYDWDNHALYRQATVRLEATAMDQLHSMRMVKFSVQQ